MARGSDKAQAAASSAQGISDNLAGESSSVYNDLAPELEGQLAHPAGFSQPDMAAMTTSAEQSAGGTQAGATGQGALLASRTGNIGSADAAIAQSARTSGEQLSKSALGIQTSNAALKQKQVEDAQHGLEGIYNTSTGGSVGALGEVANNLNANANMQNASWDWAKYILDPALAAGGQAGAAKLAAG